MRRSHSVLVLVSFLGAVALGGCGVHSYTTLEAKDATAGTTGFVFEDGPGYRGAVSARLIEGAPSYDVEVTFDVKGQSMPTIRDVRVGMSGTRWGRPVQVSSEALSVHAVQCSGMDVCDSIPSGAQSVEAARRAEPGDLDDLVLTISYIEDDGRRQVPVRRQVRAHAARLETHHYPWFIRDC